MKLPRTAEDIVREVQIASNKSGDLYLRQLIFLLQHVSHELIVEAIIRLFEQNHSGENAFRIQEFSGRILEEIKPISEKNIYDILKRTLGNWNKSIEQLPFWLISNYGVQATHAALNDDCFSSEEDKIKAIRWWLQKS